MKNKPLLTFLALSALVVGCAQIQPGNDPVVVNAERSTQVALATMDAFLQIEYNNRDMLKKVNPAIHTYAEYVRRNGQHYLQSARALTLAYKNNRSAENKANLQTAIALLNEISNQANTYAAQAKAAYPSPTPAPTAPVGPVA